MTVGLGLPDESFWRGRRVLVTGHTGFKGAWLTFWLQRLGADVLGISLEEPPTQPSLWPLLELDRVTDARADVRSRRFRQQAAEFSPEVILHLAAQSLVPVGLHSPAETFGTNVSGTIAVMELADELPDLMATLVVTSDKVYDATNAGPFREHDRLGGKDPYSASKAAAELVVAGWPARPDARGTARAGNVIGAGDWSPYRLLPDLVRAFAHGTRLELRSPTSVRPWQHVLEPIRGYLLYAQALAGGQRQVHALNFGPDPDQHVPVATLVGHAAATWQRLTGATSTPGWDVADDQPFPETHELSLDSACAQRVLGWVGVLDWRTAVDLSLDGYHGLSAGEPAAAILSRQLDGYLDHLARAA